MKTLTLYETSSGMMSIFETENSKAVHIEYDPDAPCICCGEPVVEASMGGTVVCPWCDMGKCRHTGRTVFLQILIPLNEIGQCFTASQIKNEYCS